MCGIAGVFSKDNSVSIKETVYAMSQAIKHRGPDGEGFLFFNNSIAVPVYSTETPTVNKQSSSYKFNPAVSLQDYSEKFSFAFAHRRLSIIDLSEAGHQPMCDSTGENWITFNGEIYNYIEIREELKSKGYVFFTQTDTEVVLAAYAEWEVECLQKFNGMFSFSIYDKKNNQLFCARDRVGVKPFYYINTDNVFAFASEQKALLKSNLISFDINDSQQFDFIVNGNLENSQQSLFKGIYELMPSHYLIYNLNNHNCKISKYYSLPTNLVTDKTDSEIINIIEEKLLQAIKLRLRSDVEIGSCLSGGLDSSIIAGIVNYLQPNLQMQLFTAVFPNESFDETNYANLVSKEVNGKWKTVSPIAADFFNDIETLNYTQDLPIWSTSTYSQYRVMKLASENNIKVVLDGQGADEIFAGYSHHYMALWKESFGIKSFKLMRDSKVSISNPNRMFGKQLLKDFLDLGVDYSDYFIADKKQFSKSNSLKLSKSLNEELARDYFGKLKSFLKCEDRCSMAFGIESRVPFADDIELVNYMFTIDGNKKIQNGVSKYLLREASKKYIPNQIYNRRDKVGFDTPIQKWFLPNKKQIIDTISQQLSFVDIAFLGANFETVLKKRPTFLVRLFSLAIWKKVYSNSSI
jgi:asparagine synthase (glutamine-hydrolysing)